MRKKIIAACVAAALLSAGAASALENRFYLDSIWGKILSESNSQFYGAALGWQGNFSQGYPYDYIFGTIAEISYLKFDIRREKDVQYFSPYVSKVVFTDSFSAARLSFGLSSEYFHMLNLSLKYNAYFFDAQNFGHSGAAALKINFDFSNSWFGIIPSIGAGVESPVWITGEKESYTDDKFSVYITFGAFLDTNKLREVYPPADLDAFAEEKLSAAGSYLYIDGVLGLPSRDFSSNYVGGSLGWIMNFNKCDSYDFATGFLAEIGYYQYGIAETREEKYSDHIRTVHDSNVFGVLRASAGASWGTDFMFFIKENLLYHDNESFGVSAAAGMKFKLFAHDGDRFATTLGCSLETPPTFFFDNKEMYTFEMPYLCFSMGFVFDIFRKDYPD